ncbi:D-inositol-3-phosphate glycosyltransferase [Microbulbifer aestuariivivens]|uniref:D-inositol-3-phosphate glycosyltransferase n=2 Tax=Microbulbifer aestuariivivens TaxID=1908308 RepID=A0ABP9WJR0_9GAMM
MFSRIASKFIKLVPRFLKNPVKRRLEFILFSGGSAKLGDYADYVFHGPNFSLPDHGGKKVVTIHDLSVFRFPEYHPKDRVKFMSSEVPKALEAADAIIVISEFTRNELLEYYPWAESKISVVPNGVSKPRQLDFTSKDSRCLRKLSLNRNKFFLCVSTIEPRKNLSLLVDAYLNLPSEFREEFPLVLVGGNGWKSTELIEKINSAMSRGVRYLGYVDQCVLESLYKSARTFVFPSLYEGFGLPAIEAMAYGLPVVCARSTAVSEVCGGDAMEFSGDSVSELTASLSLLCVDDELIARMSRASFERARKYSWERCCKETALVYRSAMEG